MYFTQIPTHLQRMHLEFCETCPILHDVCFVLEIQKKVKKSIEIEVISRRKKYKRKEEREGKKG